jgi:hypothetical protein
MVSAAAIGGNAETPDPAPIRRPRTVVPKGGTSCSKTKAGASAMDGSLRGARQEGCDEHVYVVEGEL